MTSTKIEFAVQMTCESCVKTVRKALENVPGIQNFDINLTTGSVTVESTLPAQEILKTLQSTGKKAVVRGLGGTTAGVAILDTGSDTIKGVVRFVQEAEDVCIIDGTVDGLNAGKHQLSVHECGDTSQGCASVGDFFNPKKSNGRIYGDLGFVKAEKDGRSAFRFDDSVIKLSDIIGRALVISEATTGKRLACGIIARSAGLFQNPKTICACDGVTIWNEKIAPNPTSSL